MDDRIFKSPKDKIKYVNTLFTKIAPRYDFMNFILSLGLDQSWRRLAVQKARFAPGGRILDLGIGTGDMAFEVMRQVDESQIIGLDICAEIMNRGRSKIKLQNVPKSIQWVMGTGDYLPFPDHIFDGVVAAFSVRNMPNLPCIFSEIYRVIVPGGKLVLLDMVKPNGYFFQKLFKFYFQYIIPRLGKWFGSHPEAYTYLITSIENFYSSEGLRNALQNLGCRDIISKDIMFNTVTICIGTK